MRGTPHAEASVNAPPQIIIGPPIGDDWFLGAGYPWPIGGDSAPVFKVVNGRERWVWVEQSAWEVDAQLQVRRWARACADVADDFKRFQRLLKTDYCLDAWLEKTPVRRLRAIWAAPAYRRPEHWSLTRLGIDGCATARWRWLCSPLRREDAIWHEIPNGEEAAYVAALDLLRWDGMRQKGDKPDLRPLGDGAERKRIVCAAADLRDQWEDWSGRPWHTVAHARRESFAAWEREWPRHRAGERLTFEPPEYLDEMRTAVWAPKPRRKAG